VSRPRLVVHGHFYQPSRIDPVTGAVPPEPSAYPARDWNTRIAADCYRPNAEVGNLGRISWDLGPTLAGWMADGDADAYQGFASGDQGRHGMAQPFHHSILPLATPRDRRTEVRWGLRDFEWRFGRCPTGMWLPETAVDLATLGILAAEGITHTILAPWQLAGEPDTRQLYRVSVGGGRSMLVVPYDGGLSTAVSFDPRATEDADRFVQEQVLPRLMVGEVAVDDSAAPFAVIATDGELYGHHRPFRELFLARLVGDVDLGYDVATLGDIVVDDGRSAPVAEIVEGTSWSCHHGIERWRGPCACVPDGAWKTRLRVAFDEFAAALDEMTERVVADLPGAPDPWAARDAYVDVVIGAVDRVAFARQWLGEDVADEPRERFLAVMDSQRWRLAMYASCGWFWDVPDRVETSYAIRAASHAATTMDWLAGTTLNRDLTDDLDGWRSAW
jgi:Domain of unknown function (DUF3536)/Glycosyl hydrolase family 57